MESSFFRTLPLCLVPNPTLSKNHTNIREDMSNAGLVIVYDLPLHQIWEQRLGIRRRSFASNSCPGQAASRVTVLPTSMYKVFCENTSSAVMTTIGCFPPPPHSCAKPLTQSTVSKHWNTKLLSVLKER